MVVSVKFVYSHAVLFAELCCPYERLQDIDVAIGAKTNVWSGNGPIVFYELFPTPDPAGSGAFSYDKVFKYRQGAIFSFRTAGERALPNCSAQLL